MTTLDDYSLDDRYTREAGRVFLTGVQALARIPVEVLRADRAQGRQTAAFVSGYQGSPLGGFDQEMSRVIGLVDDLPIVLQPAVNEELAATAVMGSQLVATQAGQRYDGVVGFWYGKAPGLDRASDALRHAAFAGSSGQGGAVALVGDDPASKSSTLPSSSDVVLVGLLMPVLYPGDVQDALDLGHHAVAMSRLTGLWTSIKVVTAVADATGTVDLGPGRVPIVVPDLEVDGKLFVPHPNARLLPPVTLEREEELKVVRLELARRYGAVNGLNHCPVDPPDAWIGIAAAGYTYAETLQALGRLGLDSSEAIAGAGIRLLNLRLPYPLHADTIRQFAKGLEEIVIVEEKGPTLERLMKDVLYGTANAPRVVGKTDEAGRTLMVSHGMLDADRIIEGLRSRLAPRIGDRLAPPPAPVRERSLIPLSTSRKPYFCSGCPHNWGTKVPDGTLVGAGIGCHGMTLLMGEDRVGDVAGITAMGGEGAQWIGMAPFLERNHFIQNLGDGTFFHSGQLAIQASVAAGVNVTYKLLYNGTVAMTGGQDATGAVGVPEIAAILLNHGVSRVLITTEDLDRYRDVDLPRTPGGGTIEVWDRRRIVEAQELLATVPGVTVLIHDQACAAQARRLRKRGQASRPGLRVVINHRVCEACGDCGEVSNCLSVQTIDTPLGPKTTIDQTSCNQDYSCLDGDCPSFMVIEESPSEPGRLRTLLGRARTGLGGSRRTTRSDDGDLPDPVLLVDPDQVAVRMAGIGGTGVVTVAQVLGTAAMIDGFDVRGLDQTGLSQKAGPVVSDLRLSRNGPALSNLIGAGEADCVIAFDLLVAASDSALAATALDRTIVVASTAVTPTGDMIGHPELAYPSFGSMTERIAGSSRADVNRYVDAAGMTRGLHGDASTANVFLLGVAYQAGCLPVGAEAIERAIDLNGVAVEANRASFRWGRRWVVEPEAVAAAAGLGPGGGGAGGGAGGGKVEMHVPPLPPDLERRVAGLGLNDDLTGLVGLLAADLVAYQNDAYAGRFLDVAAEVAEAEQRVAPGSARLTETAARGLHKLMAYKDEYEVARLLIGPEGAAAGAQVASPGARMSWKLHPPMLRALGMDRKLALPVNAARPVMVALAAGKRLRGTALDPFGRAEVRRVERALVDEYTAALRAVISRLGADSMSIEEAVAVAALADQVRGYETIKLERAAPVRAELGRIIAG